MTAPVAVGPTLVVSEVFGPTIQGEGPSAGRPAVFLRLGRCNLSCTWCDTPYTWDWTRFSPKAELERRTVVDVAAQLNDLADGTRPVPLVVVTGGEPLLQRKGLTALVAKLSADTRMEVETNGTQPPLEWHESVRYNVSPKLANSGTDARDVAVLAEFRRWGSSSLKFVCATPADVAEAAKLASSVAWPPDHVWIMPEGTTPGAVTEHTAAIADATVERGFNLSPRLHVMAWGDRRGH